MDEIDEMIGDIAIPDELRVMLEAVCGPMLVLAKDFGAGMRKPPDIAATIYSPTSTKAPCNCELCSRHYLPPDTENVDATTKWKYEKKLAPSRSAELANGFMKSIQSDRSYLQECLVSRGNTILKRWKTTAKREAYLDASDLEIPSKRFSRLGALYKWKETKDIRDLRVDRKAWLAPHLDIETLRSDPNFFFALLHGRTKYSPADFAVEDEAGINFAWDNAAVELNYSETCICMFGKQYGTIQKWEDVPVHSGDRVGFPKGILTLEAQAHIYQVLRKLVSTILQGVPSDSIAAAETWQRESAAGFTLKASESVLANQFASPLSYPVTFNIEDISSTVCAHQQVTEDYVKLLQVEPGYMRRETGMMAGVVGQNPFYFKQGIKNLWVFRELMEDIMSCVQWRSLDTSITCFKDDLEKCCDQSVNQGRPSSDEWELSSGILEKLLVANIRYSGKHTLEYLRRIPGFAQSYHLEYEEGNPNDIGKEHRVWYPSALETYRHDPLDWCILQLLSQDPVWDHKDAERAELEGRIDYFTLVSFLNDHLSKASEEENRRLDERLLRKLSNHLAMQYALERLRSFRPLSVDHGLSHVENMQRMLLSANVADSNLVDMDPDGIQEGLVEHSNTVTLILSELEKFQQMPLAEDLSDPNFASLQEQNEDIWELISLDSYEKMTEMKMDESKARLHFILLSVKDFPHTSPYRREVQAIPDPQAAKSAETGIVGKKSKKRRKKPGKKTGSDTAATALPASTSESDPQVLDSHPSPIEVDGSIVEEAPSSLDDTKKSPDVRVTTIEENSDEPESDQESEAEQKWVEDFKNSSLGDAAPKLSRKENKAAKKNRPKTELIQKIVKGKASESNPANELVANYQLKVSQADLRALIRILNTDGIVMIWRNFETLMTHATFVPIAVGGSMVEFESKLAKECGSPSKILFHRPHPDAWIPYIVMKVIGKRLRRVLGWTEETFVLLGRSAC